jgi:hypothetical protein
VKAGRVGRKLLEGPNCFAESSAHYFFIKLAPSTFHHRFCPVSPNTHKKKNMKKRGGMSRCELPFTWKLYQLLEDAEEKGYSDVVSWSPDGQSFQIYQVQTFSETVMKDNFRQKHFKSFTRQVSSLSLASNSPARCETKGQTVSDHFSIFLSCLLLPTLALHLWVFERTIYVSWC